MDKMQKFNDLISIVMPVFNVQEYISLSLFSVMRQTHNRIEIIIVDDGSTDESIKIAERIAAGDDRVRIIRQENKGLGMARNIGLENSLGEWVFFLDSDDTISLNTLESMIKTGIKFDSDFVFSDYKMVTEQVSCDVITNTESYDVDTDKLLIDFLTRKTVLIAPGTLYRKDFLIRNDLFFFPIPWSEDQHFLWRVLSKSRKVSYVKGAFYHYLVREKSIMVSTENYKKIESYHYFDELVKSESIRHPIVKKFLLARWVLGTLNSSAKSGTYSDWKTLYRQLDAKNKCKILYKFPHVKTRFLAFCLRYFPKLYWRAFGLKKTR
ncbi:MAG: glycosyltransferase [Bacilli bacterium]|nr:glycosyltransferase [Bacilli bacterium]